jgi:hypothetical protein
MVSKRASARELALRALAKAKKQEKQSGKKARLAKPGEGMYTPDKWQ